MAHSTLENQTLFQTFEWHTPSSPPPPHETHAATSHYARISRTLPSLANLGVTSIWLPPGCKANNPQGNGYDCYDIWDLGEFDQKWARSKKWGSREELRDILSTARDHGVETVWDAVLNHKTAGDTTDECWAVEVDKEDRRCEICPPKKIEAWLKYEFPGRGDTYSRMKWKAKHFNGTDWDQRAQKNAIYKIIDDPASYPKPHQQQLPIPATAKQGLNRLARFAKDVMGERTVPPPMPAPTRRPGKGWAEDVDDEHGNYDYLMFSNVDHSEPEVREDLTNWGKWMIESTGVDGFRLDAVQHFSFSFTRSWIAAVNAVNRQKNGRDAFIVGEIWTGEVDRITKWLDVVSSPAQHVWAYDSPLLYNFSRISQDVIKGSRNADLRTILRDSLLELRPPHAVTLATNHDTQPGQASYTPLDRDLKSLFYAFILLRQEGYPCVFWGDLYGTKGPHAEPPACMVPSGPGSKPRSILPDLMLARKLFAYGTQKDYFDAASCIGWTRLGTHDRPGCAVIMSIEPPGKDGKAKWTQKGMAVGRPGERWVDILADEGETPTITIDAKGCGLFACKSMSVSVYVRSDARGKERFPVGFNADVYGSRGE